MLFVMRKIVARATAFSLAQQASELDFGAQRVNERRGALQS
jgi:hypothetical protein